MNTAFPSEAAVVFSDYQQLTSVDLNDTATIPQATTDNVVAAFLAAGQGYTGLGVAANQDALGVTVGTGILYNLGGGFPLRAASNIDLTPQINLIPDQVSSQVVLIVASGGAAKAEETRTLEDASKKPSNPADLWATVQQVLTTRMVRSCTPAIVTGPVAVTNPQAPPFNPLLCLLATVVINKTGVISVTQSTAARITRLDQLAPLVVAQGAQLSGYQALLNGLLSSVASIQKTITDGFAADRADILALQGALTVLGNKVAALPTSAGGGTTYNYTFTDYYNDTSGLTVQPSNPTYTVGGGLGFPAATATPGSFSPVNPNAGNIKLIGGRYLMPAYTEVVASLVSGPGPQDKGTVGPVAINTFSPLTTPTQARGFGVERTRYGAPLQAQATGNVIATGDPTVLFGVKPGDLVYDPSWAPWTANSPEISHGNGYQHDLTSRGYWTPRQAGNPVSGLPALIQSFVPSADQMVTGIDFGVQRGTFGDIRLIVCDALPNSQSPDFSRVVADVTCPVGAIDATSDINGVMGVARFPMPYPILEKLGKVYCYVLVTPGDHKFWALGGGYVYNTGQASTLQAYTLVGGQNPAASGPSGTYAIAGSVSDVLVHRKRIASFAAPAADVPLNPFYNGGGTDLIDVLTPAIVPQGCDITYKLQSANGGTTALGPISAAAPNLLAGRPSTVPLTATLSGTGNTAPIIDLGVSVSGTVSGGSAKQAAALGPVESRVYQLKDASGNALAFTNVVRAVTLIGFDPTIHTYAEALELAPGYAAAQAQAPTSTSTPIRQSDGTYLVTIAWKLAAGVVGVKALISGTTQNAAQGFKSTVTTTLTA